LRDEEHTQGVSRGEGRKINVQSWDTEFHEIIERPSTVSTLAVLETWVRRKLGLSATMRKEAEPGS
jgi:hypothetical protein